MFSEKLLNVFCNTSKCFSEDFSMFLQNIEKFLLSRRLTLQGSCLISTN